MTNSEARKRRAEALLYAANAEDTIARLTAERDEAVAEVRDYRRALDFGITCISCARTLEDMHALEAQVAAVAELQAERDRLRAERDQALTTLQAVRELADDWVREAEPAGFSLSAILNAADGGDRDE